MRMPNEEFDLIRHRLGQYADWRFDMLFATTVAEANRARESEARLLAALRVASASIAIVAPVSMVGHSLSLVIERIDHAIAEAES